MASGNLQLWLVLPLAIAAEAAGAVVGYTWTRAVGTVGLQAFARRLHITRQVEGLSTRLQSAGPAGICLCRLIPGLRINTTLLSGALGVRRDTFILGVIPAMAIWTAVFMGLGMVAGEPVIHVVRQADHWMLRGGILIAIGIAWFLAARHLPLWPAAESRSRSSRAWAWLAGALTIDLAAVVSIAVGLHMLATHVLHLSEPDGWGDTVAVVAIISLAYLVLTRARSGRTTGEALCGVTYRDSPDLAA